MLAVLTLATADRVAVAENDGDEGAHEVVIANAQTAMEKLTRLRALRTRCLPCGAKGSQHCTLRQSFITMPDFGGSRRRR
jgi:hypothetical protein